MVNLSYISQKLLFSYLDLTTRLILSQKCPQLNRLNNSTALKIKHLEHRDNTITMNGTTLKLRIIQIHRNLTVLNYFDHDVDKFGISLKTGPNMSEHELFLSERDLQQITDQKSRVSLEARILFYQMRRERIDTTNYQPLFGHFIQLLILDKSGKLRKTEYLRYTKVLLETLNYLAGKVILKHFKIHNLRILGEVTLGAFRTQISNPLKTLQITYFNVQVQSSTIYNKAEIVVFLTHSTKIIPQISHSRFHFIKFRESDEKSFVSDCLKNEVVDRHISVKLESAEDGLDLMDTIRIRRNMLKKTIPELQGTKFAECLSMQVNKELELNFYMTEVTVHSNDGVKTEYIIHAQAKPAGYAIRIL